MQQKSDNLQEKKVLSEILNTTDVTKHPESVQEDEIILRMDSDDKPLIKFFGENVSALK